ncbi:DUF3267 domain-containing protein [Staphylococcus saccharolyticus]|uniref:Permease n=1 Tax=Staphylococcus saccharolyticus TaxID=33028 RepID=A0A380H383_9STAP|nr:DUF3267 domain-containing protein [Staphylococcus saccharolyticus]MBL7565942.1 DUF3267 domain-containing protein [Staphylococcus saccharolyticus]MBL7572381.1 DUF3267 domain-containing protein [Staphylococcus saccharolyticus]QQB98519.1 DUF3267 domain-containing protein [Staphylococcus saccharolyticus]QRJ67265.1 DUF3267 domain-containing protein [Staphylococcus saccharolyticus]SUM70258.1 Permease [Staphylococcus saccharolyticus]
MHKIDLSESKFQIQRFVLFQIVLALFAILFTYKWAYTTTHVIEQNLMMNLIYGFIGFVILLIIHEFIHRILFIAFSKGEKSTLKYKKSSIIVQFSNTCFNRWQFSIIMLAPLVIISLSLLLVLQAYSYSSLIFMFSMHMSYCMIDVFLVALALQSKFKYIQKYDEGLYLYQQKPTQSNIE